MFFYFFIIERGNSGKERRPRVVIVAQLAERSLPISEFCGSNPVIGEIL